MQTLYHVNVGFKVFFICKPPSFLLLMLNHYSYIFPRRPVSFWFFFFLLFCYMILKAYSPSSSYSSVDMFYYFSKNVFTHVSYLQNFCGIGAVLSLWAHHTFSNPALSTPSWPQGSTIRTVPGWQLQGPRASKGQLIPAATLEREICSPQKISC